MKIQAGDQWVNNFYDTIVAFDNGGKIGFKVNYGDRPDLGWGFAATLKLAKKAVTEHRKGEKGSDNWLYLYDLPREK